LFVNPFYLHPHLFQPSTFSILIPPTLPGPLEPVVARH
jgi:hypothetical protein